MAKQHKNDTKTEIIEKECTDTCSSTNDTKTEIIEKECTDTCSSD